MLRVAVVESSAEQRAKLVSLLTQELYINLKTTEFLPRVEFSPLAISEISLKGTPDICLIGPELVETNSLEIKKIRNLLPHSALVILYKNPPSIAELEQLARLGVDDFISITDTAEEKIKRFLLHIRKKARESKGIALAVGSAKGGSGVTTIAAGLAESLYEQGRKVCLVDLDFETQDLTRFLRVKPAINENLALLCAQQRPVNPESISDATQAIWEGNNEFSCLAPVPETEEYSLHRILPLVVEHLKATFDVVVFDLACARQALVKVVCEQCENYLYVCSAEPASVYPAALRLSQVRSYLPKGANLAVLENFSGLGGIKSAELQSAVSKSLNLEENCWVENSIKFNKSFSAWPASGATVFSLGGREIKSIFKKILAKFNLEIHPVKKPAKVKFFNLRSRKHNIIEQNYFANESNPEELKLQISPKPELAKVNKALPFIEKTSLSINKSELNSLISKPILQ